MSVNSREKGAQFERDLAKYLRDRGYDSRRGQQYCGTSGDADVVGLPGIHIEAKRREKMELYTWMAQAVRDSEGTGDIPVVIHKQSRKDILVTMRLDDFMKIYEKGRE